MTCDSLSLRLDSAYNKLKSPNQTNKKVEKKTPLLMQITNYFW